MIIFTVIFDPKHLQDQKKETFPGKSLQAYTATTLIFFNLFMTEAPFHTCMQVQLCISSGLNGLNKRKMHSWNTSGDQYSLSRTFQCFNLHPKKIYISSVSFHTFCMNRRIRFGHFLSFALKITWPL